MNDDIKAVRLFNIYGYTGMNYAGNVWDINGLSPALLTMTGGNRQPLIIIEDFYKNRPTRVYKDYAPSLRSERQDLKVLKEGFDMGNIRIRKLTPTECYKLMGFTAEDCKKCSEGGISNSQLYKQAGNSIVVNVLEAIFLSLSNDYKEFEVCK